MFWIGVLAGITCGATFQSFEVGMAATVVFAVIGAAFDWRRRTLKERADAMAVSRVQSQIKQLEVQWDGLLKRMTALEGMLKAQASDQDAAQGSAPTLAATPTTASTQTQTQAQSDPAATDAHAASATLPDAAALASEASKAAEPDYGLTDWPPRPAAPAPASDMQLPPTPMVQSEREPMAPPGPRMLGPLPSAGKPTADVAASMALPSPTAAPRASVTLAAAVVPPVPTVRPAPPAPPNALTRFIRRWIVGINSLVMIGVLILFLGLAFLLRYAAERAVFPVQYRYVGVAATGIALLLVGWRWRFRKDSFGLILQGGGVAVLYLTTLAAMRLHPLIPPTFGFAILIGVAVFAALLAVVQDSLALALAATVGGFAAPVLAASGNANHVALFSYLTLLNLGVVSIAWFKAWRPLNLVGFTGTLMLAGGWAAKSYKPEDFASVEPFLILFFMSYVLITFLFARRTLAQADTGLAADLSAHAAAEFARTDQGYLDGWLVFGVPTACFGLQVMLVKPFAYGAAFSALGVGLFYIVLAWLLFKGNPRRYRLLSETMIALAVVFGSLAIPLGLERQWTSAAWALEAAGVYWISIRQQRQHARWFALLLLLGSVMAFLAGLGRGDADHAVYGSALDCLLLVVGCGLIGWLMRTAKSSISAAEQELAASVIAMAAFIASLLPFLLLPLGWACPALALAGAGLVFIGQRWAQPGLLHQGLLTQLAAGGLFLGTLRLGDNANALGNGSAGLLAAAVIGASLLGGVHVLTRRARQANPAGGGSALAVSTAMLAGLAFLNLAPLFVLPWRMAVLVWPVSGLLMLQWALRTRHMPALAFALILELVAGLGFMMFALQGAFFQASAQELTAFRNLPFAGSLLIALAAFVCAGLMHRKTADQGEQLLGWILLVWAGCWWSRGWFAELARLVSGQDLHAAVVGIIIASVLIAVLVARRRSWTQLGQASRCYLPLLLVPAFGSWLDSPHPMAGWGALAWPAALLTHGLLLRRQAAWVAPSWMTAVHVLGVWFFLFQAAFELRWHFATLGGNDMPFATWALLGWMIVPVSYLWLVGAGRAGLSGLVQRHWPVRDFPDAYRHVACVPLVLYLLAWIWITNGISDGSADPLPYLPLINPLELAQLAALLGIATWSTSRPGTHRLAHWTLDATGLFLISGMVLRACHHLGRVPWDLQSLLASNVAETALSITWAVIALALMVVAHRRLWRQVWIVGAALMGTVVAKMFLVELSDTGSLTRIVSFIVVGLLLLVVGYLAPLPPKPGTMKKESSA